MAYSSEVWGKVKADYETGLYSVDKLQEKYGISTASIDKRMAKDKPTKPWIKGKTEDKIHKKIEENTIERLARLKYTQDKHLNNIIAGTEADRTYIKKDGSGEGFIEVEPDHQSRVKYLDMINKMTGGYAPEKIEHSGEISIAEQIRLAHSKKEK